MLKLLYVDDDDDIRELATFSLALDPDIEVTIAASGADALQVIGKTQARSTVRHFRPNASSAIGKATSLPSRSTATKRPRTGPRTSSA